MKSVLRILIFVGIGFLLGLIWIIAVRTALAKNTKPHYHANFAVFVGSERLKFEGPTFYEEVTACSADQSTDPKTRGHMHENVSNVVHAHDELVTWGDFFANLRYGISDKALTLDDVVLVDGQDGNKLVFVLNGETTTSIANKVIGSEDRLLISYGQAGGQELQAQYEQVENTAKDYNQKQDPSSCSGTEDLPFKERLKKALSIN